MDIPHKNNYFIIHIFEIFTIDWCIIATINLNYEIELL